MKRVIGLFIVAACGSSKAVPPPAPPPAAPGPATSPAPAPDGPVPIAWKVTAHGADRVTVQLDVAGTAIEMGTLDAASDDGTPAAATCTVKAADATSSELHCGATPAWNYLVARIDGGELIVTKVSGVEGERREKRAEVGRIAVHGTRLAAATLDKTPAKHKRHQSAVASKDCQPGYVRQGGSCQPTCKTNEDCAKYGMSECYLPDDRDINPDGSLGPPKPTVYVCGGETND